MSIDWENERYIRLYQRETPDQSCWCWQALAIWPWLLVKAERSGELQTRKGLIGLAALTKMPLEVVQVGMDDLLADGCIVETDHGYAIRNYVEAQNAVSSDTKRKADQRARERLDESLTGKRTNKSVTPGHAESRGVTSGHEMSLRSDPSGTEPNRTKPPLPPLGGSDGVQVKPKPKRVKPSDATPVELETASRVLERITSRTGVAYEGSQAHVRLIAGRLRDGITERDLRGVVLYAWSELGWEAKPEMHQYLRPETLFGPQTIHKYLPGARAYLAKHFPETPQHNGKPAPIAATLFARHQEPS